MANQKGETTSIGHFYNRCVDAVNNLFDTMSFWTHSKDVEFVDGKNAETKVGAINGITSDISGEADDIAASIKCVNQLNSSLGGVSQFIVDETTGKITGYKTEIGGADTVFPFNTLTFIGNSDSQYVRTFSIASIDNNYSEYTASNFIINVTNVITKNNVTEYQSTESLIKSYDSNTGILTINKVLHGNQWNEHGLYLEYEVYIRT